MAGIVTRFVEVGRIIAARAGALRFPLGKLRLALTASLAVSVVLTISLRSARVQTSQTATAKKQATVHAAAMSDPLVHLQDGYELSGRFGKDAQVSAAIESGLGNPLSLVAADFDEDGVPDLVSGYANGKLALYRGNPDAILPNSRAA